MREGPDRYFRDRRIEEFYRAGLAPSEIAKRVNLMPDRVRSILKERGFRFEVVPSVRETIWDLDVDKRRQAIWERARKAAREALQGA